MCCRNEYQSKESRNVFKRITLRHLDCGTYFLLDVLLCSIAEYFYELCRILASP